MSRTKGLTALALTGALALALTAGASADAEAGFKRFRHFDGYGFHGFHGRHIHFGVRRRGFHRGCGFYKFKWHATGRFYWKKRYFACRGWY